MGLVIARMHVPAAAAAGLVPAPEEPAGVPLPVAAPEEPVGVFPAPAEPVGVFPAPAESVGVPAATAPVALPAASAAMIDDCPVCLDTEWEDPKLITTCGHTICGSCIASLMDEDIKNHHFVHRCPLCRKLFFAHDLVRNLAFRDTVLNLHVAKRAAEDDGLREVKRLRTELKLTQDTLAEVIDESMSSSSTAIMVYDSDEE